MKQANGSEIIYLSPQDALPTVRERLAQIAVRRIILVVPLQTQLRTYSIWRALYAHARRLGKDVRVVSTDTQIRSAARGAKFQVSRSLNATSASKPQHPQARPSPRRSYPQGAESSSVHSPASDDNLIFDIPTPAAELTFSSDTSFPQQLRPPNDPLSNAVQAELDEQLTIIRLPEPEERPMPMRLPKPPKPLDMPHGTGVRMPPRRPHWDDDSEALSAFATSRLPPRRTHLVPPPVRRTLSRKQPDKSNPLISIAVTFVLLIGLYIIIAAVMEYMRGNRK